VHNYQRTVPIRFAPAAKQPKGTKVNGTFTLDTAFDGRQNTVPNGVIHVTAGGGGASLYGPALEKVADELKKAHGANFAPFVARSVVDRHSFVILDASPEKIEFRAIGIDGGELDRIVVTKK